MKIDSLKEIPDKKNARFYRGRSMRGTFRPGDYLYLKQVPISDVHSGDIIVFRNSNSSEETKEMVHRVIKSFSRQVITQGDNNPRMDSLKVSCKDLIGKVIYIERNGKTYAVKGGLRGLLRAKILHALIPLKRAVKWILSPPYSLLQKSGLVCKIWYPEVKKIYIKMDNSFIIKFISRNKTVACWWPESGRFICIKPYDLVIRDPRYSFTSERNT